MSLNDINYLALIHLWSLKGGFIMFKTDCGLEKKWGKEAMALLHDSTCLARPKHVCVCMLSFTNTTHVSTQSTMCLGTIYVVADDFLPAAAAAAAFPFDENRNRFVHVWVCLLFSWCILLGKVANLTIIEGLLWNFAMKVEFWWCSSRWSVVPFRAKEALTSSKGSCSKAKDSLNERIKGFSS